MKLASYSVDGASRFGLVVDGGIVDLSRRLGRNIDSLRALISTPDWRSRVEPYLQDAADVALADINLLPVIAQPAKILCIGLNYESHRKETGRAKTEFPSVFTRFADTQIGHENDARLPPVSDMLDYEGELALIVGKPGRYIDKSNALQHVAGYACYNDMTIRDYQRHTIQFTPGKNFPGTGAFGPYLVTADEVGDPTKLSVTTRLNGEVMQQAPTNRMIFDIPTIIAYVSSFTPLSVGDVIATGTPGGVGFKREPQVFMKPGDVVEVDIPAVGVLRNTIVADTR